MKNASYKFGFLMVGLLVTLACAHFVLAASQTGSVQGVVKDASGDPVAGAFVKLKNADRRLVFMVVSRQQGRYVVNNLPPGQYVVQGIGGDRQSDLSSPVDVQAGAKATVDLALTAERAPDLPHAWPGLKPGEEAGENEAGMGPIQLPDGAGKDIVAVKCQQCHDAARIVSNHASKARWQSIVEQMRAYMEGSSQAKPITDDEAKTVVEYLSANFTPPAASAKMVAPDPNSRLPWQLQKGDAANYETVEFTLPDPTVNPHEVAADTDGNAWVSQRANGHLGRLDAKTLEYTQIEPPAGPSKDRLNGITRGQGNLLWFMDGGPNRRWFSIDTKTQQFTEYPLPPLSSGSASGNTMRVKSDGTVWLCSIAANQVISLDPTTKKFTIYDVPSGVKAGKTAYPYGLAFSGDGKVWFVENAMNKVGRIDPKTGQIDEFDVPLANAVPRKAGMDAEGNIWVGLHGAGKLMKINYETTKMTIFTPPTENAGIYSIQGMTNGKGVWLSEQQADKIARFDPATQTFTEFSLPSPEEDGRKIDVDPTNPNKIWWTGESSGRMGYIEYLGSSKSSTSKTAGSKPVNSMSAPSGN